MNFIKNRIDRPAVPLPKPLVYRHIDLRPKSNKLNTKSIHETLNGTLASREPYVVTAIAEGRGHACLEIGLAAIDVSAPVLRMTQFSDNFWYSNVLTSLQALNPVVIFFSDHSLNAKVSTLPGIIRQFLPDVQIVGLPRSYFNDYNAEKHLDDICSFSYRAVKEIVCHKYYGLAAVGAILRHCFENGLFRIAPKSLQFRYLNKSNTLAIDVECATHLELIYSLRKMSDKHSLYQLLNYCITSVGKRHLRANLLEPSSSRDALESRLNCIGELLRKPEVLAGIQKVLHGVVDIGGLMKLALDVDNMKTTKQNTMHVLHQAITLRNALRCVPELLSILQNVETSLLIEIRHTLCNETYKNLSEKINSVLDAKGDNLQATADYHRLFLVKARVSSTLDVLRGLYSEVIDEIREYVASLTRELRLLLKMTFTKTLGYHIQVCLKENTPTLPEIFKLLNRSGKRLSLTTNQLQAFNERINGVIREIELVSYEVIKHLIEQIRTDVDPIYVLVAHVTDLDLLQSLAVVSQDKQYCRPSFGRSTKVVSARHPLLESYGEIAKVVKNNIIATPEYNAFIVTGPNMSGKTVYMKTICVLQVMAQLGCHIPASSAEFRIADRLMAIFGAAEHVEQDLSNSSRLTKKLEFIFCSLTIHSLIVIDEFFGDTQCPDVCSPEWKRLESLVSFIGFEPEASCKSLSAVRRPFIYLTTHCHDMLRPLEHLHNVSRLCLQTETLHVGGYDRLRYKYTVAEGKTNVKNYGISLARCVRIPESVILRAEAVCERLKRSSLGCVPVPHNSTTLNETFSTQANIQRFDKRLYDFHAQIAVVLAETDADDLQTFGTRLNGLLEGFVGSLPAEVVEYIRKTPLPSLLRRERPLPGESFATQGTSVRMEEGSDAETIDNDEAIEIDETIRFDDHSEEFGDIM
ncbi:mutS protein homolog 4-like [Toxorhynchites rutilus septentrionalis]|uniref:mutS protein homolog 4-like n=1 Tax=Toxorhynchites rutilus septentrionalis TaxID=329112 RepID=UPI00247A48F7|nr:mutS protein homolog 4-like [Toxorhynchites rutilus septentrionalis]